MATSTITVVLKNAHLNTRGDNASIASNLFTDYSNLPYGQWLLDGWQVVSCDVYTLGKYPVLPASWNTFMLALQDPMPRNDDLDEIGDLFIWMSGPFATAQAQAEQLNRFFAAVSYQGVPRADPEAEPSLFYGYVAPEPIAPSQSELEHINSADAASDAEIAGGRYFGFTSSSSK